MKPLERINRILAESRSVADLADALSGSELNTFLLSLFHRRSDQISPAALMAEYRRNRFVQFADLDPVAFKEFELDWLKKVAKEGFEPSLLSPVCPVGTSSVIASVDQNKVLSASRGTEVVSDATNVLALKLADFHRHPANRQNRIRYGCTHRHIRGQAFANPAFSAHFSILCLVSGGYDPGSFGLELEELSLHMRLHYDLLASRFETEKLTATIYLKQEEHPFNQFLRTAIEQDLLPFPVALVQEENPGNYYRLFQFKIYLHLPDGNSIDLADGGMVDWTQQLLSNRKHRMMISATGLELAYKLGSG